jgi:hypothetical protein
MDGMFTLMGINTYLIPFFFQFVFAPGRVKELARRM